MLELRRSEPGFLWSLLPVACQGCEWLRRSLSAAANRHKSPQIVASFAASGAGFVSIRSRSQTRETCIGPISRLPTIRWVLGAEKVAQQLRSAQRARRAPRRRLRARGQGFVPARRATNRCCGCYCTWDIRHEPRRSRLKGEYVCHAPSTLGLRTPLRPRSRPSSPALRLPGYLRQRRRRALSICRRPSKATALSASRSSSWSVLRRIRARRGSLLTTHTPPIGLTGPIAHITRIIPAISGHLSDGR